MYLHSMNTYIYLKYIFAFFYRFKPTEVAEKLTCKLSEDVTVSNNSNF